MSFGKGSSSIVGAEFEVSCAEVELALAARKANWEGGWVNSFRPDSRFPTEWLDAVISKRAACALLSREFDASRFADDDGFPDLGLAFGSMVVRAECKRQKDFWWNNDGKRMRWGGDTPKKTQVVWDKLTRRAGQERGRRTSSPSGGRASMPPPTAASAISL